MLKLSPQHATDTLHISAVTDKPAVRGLTLSPTSIALLILLVITIITEAVTWYIAGPWWIHIVTLSIIVVLIGILIYVVFSVATGAIEDDGIEFLTCPACGTKIPRALDGRHECYNCGRNFSELSGRHPVLPPHVKGRDD